MRTKEEGNPLTTGYFIPRDDIKHKLRPIQEGLVDWNRKTMTTLVNYANMNKSKTKIHEGEVVGQVYFLTEDDAKEMEIFHIAGGKKSMRKRAELSRQKIEQDLKRRNRQNEPTTPPEPRKVRINEKYKEDLEKMGINARFENSIEEGLTVFPPPLQAFLVHSVDYFDSVKEHHDPRDDVWKVKDNDMDELISCLHTHVKEQNTPPNDPEMREIYDKFELHKADVNQEQCLKLIELLRDFRSIWDKNNEAPIDHTTAAECTIDLEPGTKPIRQKARSTTQKKSETIWGFIENMQGRRVIRPSKSAWASPILLAAKKNGKWRFCVDYRRLNDVTIKDAYPLPKIDGIIASLGGGKLRISTFDLTDAFWSIPMRKEDIEKTAFITKFGLWEFISMPFGLSNAPATQQRFIESILQGLLWKCCFAYIDDIICFSRDFDQHLIDIRAIFERLAKNGLKLQPPKCNFLRPTFEILGYVASADGLKPNPKKVEAIEEFPVPRTRKEVLSFLEICSWLRRFIPNFSKRTVHLRQCSQKDTFSFKMTSEAIEEFKDLKEVICSDTCLAHPDMDKEFYIHVDASGVGIGAILTQLDENRRHRIIEYASTAFSNGKDKSNPEREAYGINWALEHFKYYVLGRNPIIYCDCSCLMDIFKTRDQSKSRIFNVWITRLLHYSPRLLHKPGKLMAIPDALSRSSRHYVEYKESDSQDVKINLLEKMVQNALQNATQPDITLRKQGNMLDDYAVSEEQWDENLPQLRDTLKCNAMVTRSRSRAEEKEELPDNDGDVPMPDAVSNSQHNDQEPAPAANSSPQDNVSTNELVVKQRSDPVLSRIIEHLEFSSKRKRCNNLSMKIIRSIVNQYSIDENGVLRIDVVPVEANSHDNPIVLPSSMVEMVLKQYHDTLLGGHQNAEKMLANLRRHYYFDGMVQYVHYYCSTCEACQISTRFKTPTAPLKPYFASYPNVLVHLDCTPGPNMTKPTKRGNSHILAIVDSFTNYCRLYAIPNPSGAVVARVLLLYISVNSMPLKIVTDNGSEFANELQSELAILLDLKRTRILPYNSKGNGKVEVAHKSVQRMLRAFIDDHTENWDEILPNLEFAINTTKNSGTGVTPFFLHFGREPIMPIDAYLEVTQLPKVTTDEWVKQIGTERKETFEWVAQYRADKTKKYAEKYNERHKSTNVTFHVGDIVRIFNKGKVGEHGESYNPINSHEVYRIVEMHNDNTSCTLRNILNDEKTTMNISMITKVPLWYEVDIHANSTHTQTAVPNDIEDKGKEEESEGEWRYEVERILDKKKDRRHGTMYKVKWVNYPIKSKATKWLPEKDLHCDELIEEFNNKSGISKTKSRFKKKK